MITKQINIPLARPTVPEYKDIEPLFTDIFNSGMLTNAKYVSLLEEKVAEYLGVAHVVAVSSCTSGLILSHQALGLSGEVIMPSFTFSATAHSLAWNRLDPVLVDSDRQTFNIDIDLTEAKINSRTSAILAVDIFGNPCDRQSLKDLAIKYGIKLIVDSAHGMGSLYRGEPLGGWGDAEVFSLSPTKVMVAGEGGLIATNDSQFAGQLKKARNYGDPGDYNCEFAGLNARMSEFHAAIALKSLEQLEQNATARNTFVNRYKELLGDVPGIKFQSINNNDRCSYKDFSLYIDEEFTMSRGDLADKLLDKGIQTKPYFDPPIHKQDAYQPRSRSSDRLEIAEALSANCLSIPLYSHMPMSELDTVARSISDIASGE